MSTSTSLLDWILSLLRDPDARAAFQADPDGYAAHHGFQNLTPADVHDALCLIADSASASYDHKFAASDVKFAASDVHYPPPPHYDAHHDAPQYLNHYITNNYKIIDQHNTYVDDSVHQHVDTHGGDFDQHIDNDPVVASGDHSIATHGDIHDSTLTTGESNVIGHDNQAVTGDDNTTAFGSGDAASAHLGGTHLDDGGALSLGGDARGTNAHSDTTTSVHGSGSGDTSVNAAGSHGDASQLVDQHEQDSSTHGSYDDRAHTDSHDQVGSHDALDYDDSHNYDVHH
jgi:hypothetical protein